LRQNNACVFAPAKASKIHDPAFIAYLIEEWGVIDEEDEDEWEEE